MPFSWGRCGKGMSGGYMPVGAVLTTDRVVHAVNGAGGFAHGFTFSHNPMTATACLKTREVLEDEDGSRGSASWASGFMIS